MRVVDMPVERMDALERMSAVCEVRDWVFSSGLVLGSLMSFSHGSLGFVSH